MAITFVLHISTSFQMSHRYMFTLCKALKRAKWSIHIYALAVAPQIVSLEILGWPYAMQDSVLCFPTAQCPVHGQRQGSFSFVLWKLPLHI